MGRVAPGLMLLNAGIGLAYGVVVARWPSSTADTPLPLAPNTDELPEARLFAGGFSAHQVGVGLAGLATTLLEARARGRWDEDLVGGAVFSGAGLATALAAWRAG